MTGTWIIILAVLISVQRLIELRIASRNREWALSQGAQESGAGHYPLFFLLHIGWMAGWIIEGWNVNRLSDYWFLWTAVFICAQLLRYWAIRSLGNYWNTRILVVPNAGRVQTGPYRFIRHPNYLAVVLELLSVPLIFGAWRTALAASLLNALLLLLIRIPAEERALNRAEGQS